MTHNTIELPNTKATLTAYVHDQSREMPNLDLRPAMLVVPGGGYQFCSDREAEPIALAYFAKGYNAFVLQYTIGAERPFKKAFADGEAAIKYIRANEAQYNLLSGKLAAVGFSAGGHLVASLATLSSYKPDAVVLCYGVLTSQYGTQVGVDLPDTTQCVSESTPPSFIFATSSDPVVTCDNSLQYAAAMARAKRPFELHIFEKGGHGLSLCTKETACGKAELLNQAAEKWFDMSICFLNRQFSI